MKSIVNKLISAATKVNKISPKHAAKILRIAEEMTEETSEETKDSKISSRFIDKGDEGGTVTR